MLKEFLVARGVSLEGVLSGYLSLIKEKSFRLTESNLFVLISSRELPLCVSQKGFQFRRILSRHLHCSLNGYFSTDRALVHAWYDSD